MKIALIESSKNIASQNIKRAILKLYNLTNIKKITIHSFDKEIIAIENVDEEINADLFVFLSTHKSASGEESFCVHCPGNYSKAELGGQDGKLCISPALFIRQAFLNLRELTDKTTLEVTHHGPYLGKKPCFFIEIGSSEKEWNEEWRGKLIAKALMKTLQNKVEEKKVGIGIGGNHYCPNFNKIINNIALGHIIPKYAVQYLDKNMLLQMIIKTTPKPEIALLDWKGLGSDKQRIISLLEEVGLKWAKTKEFKQKI